tara:strand:+ start:802 stop:1014 length:213 start_codon:yes stop_codon:yes gene_type:complete
MSIILDTPEQINDFRNRTLLMGLKVEITSNGFQLTRGRSCYARIKSQFGFKGNKQKVYDQFKECIDNGVL